MSSESFVWRLFDPDFCEHRCPVCVRARQGSRFARFLKSVEEVVTFGGCPWCRAREKKYGVKSGKPLPCASDAPQCDSCAACDPVEDLESVFHR
jgi:hypothetical protein